MKFFIITFYIETYAHFTHSQIGFVFSNRVKDAKAQRVKGTEENNL